MHSIKYDVSMTSYTPDKVQDINVTSTQYWYSQETDHGIMVGIGRGTYHLPQSLPDFSHTGYVCFPHTMAGQFLLSGHLGCPFARKFTAIANESLHVPLFSSQRK